MRPKQVVSSQVYDWSGILTQILTGLKAGKLGGASYAITLKNGGEKIEYNPGYHLSASVKAKAQKEITGIENGSIKVPA